MNRIHLTAKALIEVIRHAVGSRITGLGEMLNSYPLPPCPEQLCSQRETRSRRFGAQGTREPLEDPQTQQLDGPDGVPPRRGRSEVRQAGERPGSDDQPLVWCGVGNGSVVVDESRVKRYTIHIEGDRGELDTQRQMMPLAVTHLSESQDKTQLSSKTSTCTYMMQNKTIRS